MQTLINSHFLTDPRLPRRKGSWVNKSESNLQKRRAWALLLGKQLFWIEEGKN